MVWYQLFVKTKGEGYPHRQSEMRLIDNALNYHGVFIVSSELGPIKGEDGTWEVRAPEVELDYAKNILLNNNLEIVREVVNGNVEIPNQ